MSHITTTAALEALYGEPGETSLVKELDHLTDEYATFLEAAPFVALATVGPEGLDCSPRGDQSNVARVRDARTLELPDRRGNNRVDSLRNVVLDPRVALLFLVPGSTTTLRVNGRAHLDDDADLLAAHAVEGALPRSVLVVAIDAVYFQCARALVRSKLWDPDRRVDPTSLPTAGQMLAAASQGRVGGAAYDDEWPARATASLW